MKKLLLAFAMLSTVTFTACKKDNTEEPPAPETVCLPTKVTGVNTDGFNGFDTYVTMNFDANKRLTSVGSKYGANVKIELVYTDNRITSLRWFEGATPFQITDFTYNTQGQVTKIEQKSVSSSGMATDITYTGNFTYGTNGANTTITETQQGGPEPQTTVYEFNSNGYLVKTPQVTYTYDSAPAKMQFGELNIPFPVLVQLSYFDEDLLLTGYGAASKALPTRAVFDAGNGSTVYTSNYTDVVKNEKGFVTSFKEKTTNNSNSAENVVSFTINYDCK